MSRSLLITVLALAGVGAVCWLALTIWSRVNEADPTKLAAVPAGRWHIMLPGQASNHISDDEDARARVMSLPYLAGRYEAAGQAGVTVHDAQSAWDGVNLYASGHGPEAVLLDMGGEVLHRWRLPYGDAFDAVREGAEVAYWRRVHLFPDGSLLAIFQAGGMIKIDRRSRLEWVVDEGFYNDIEVTGDGEILTIGKAARIVEAINPDARVLEDSVVRIGPDGRIRGRFSLLRAFLDSPFRSLLEPMARKGDIFHSNTVEWLDGSLAERSPMFRRGNLLVSLREVDIVAIVDPQQGIVEWAARGPWDAQHQPTLLADGKVLLFDNRGAGGLSRLVEVDPATDEITWTLANADALPFASPEAGTSQRLPGGTTLVTESERGRAFEVTREGEIVWEFVSPHRAGEDGRLVATLFEVVRLSRGELLFLSE